MRVSIAASQIPESDFTFRNFVNVALMELWEGGTR